MYSVLFSRIEIGMDLVSDKLKQIIPKNSKVAIFPWAFPVEIDAQKLKERLISQLLMLIPKRILQRHLRHHLIKKYYLKSLKV